MTTTTKQPKPKQHDDEITTTMKTTTGNKKPSYNSHPLMSQNMTKQTAAHGSTTAHSNNHPINQPINTYLYLDDMKYEIDLLLCFYIIFGFVL